MSGHINIVASRITIGGKYQTKDGRTFTVLRLDEHHQGREAGRYPIVRYHTGNGRPLTMPLKKFLSLLP